MTILTSLQYSLITNMFSFTIAAMGAAFIFFLASRSQVLPKYRGALLISGLVVAIACYHYVRILESFTGAFTFTAGMYQPSGKPFNDAYRYVDWLLTVPLLLLELAAVVQLGARAPGQGLTAKLMLAAVLMILTGYPGEISTSMTSRAVWGAISTIPFVYILFILWVKLGEVLNKEKAEVQVLIRNTRWLLLATWGFYPITYLLPQLGVDPSSSVVGVQVGYAIADVLAKAGYGVMIYAIASAKTEAEGGLEVLA